MANYLDPIHFSDQETLGPGSSRPQGGASREGMSFILSPLPPPIPLWRDGAHPGQEVNQKVSVTLSSNDGIHTGSPLFSLHYFALFCIYSVAYLWAGGF